MIPAFKLLKPFSRNEALDIEEALKGDYKGNYYNVKKDIILLPESQSFQERLDNSKLDNLNVESTALNYRFLVPFIIKAELNPGLAFSEALLSLIHILACKFPYDTLRMCIADSDF